TRKSPTNTHHYQVMACCFGDFLGVILLVGIIVSVYFTSVISAENEQLKMMKQPLNSLKNNQTTLLEINRNLTDLNNELSSENERLRRDKDDQTAIIGNLTKEYNVSEMKINKLTAENQELKTQMEDLTEQIKNIANNFTVAQQIIDTYCPIKDENRQCKPCLQGWEYHHTSCYAVNNPDKEAYQKTWEEAQEYCRGKNSDLAVIVNEAEKKFIRDNSWGQFRTHWLLDWTES
ncbi:C-type lectin domain family 10 member A-like, partial [Scomber scombrus]